MKYVPKFSPESLSLMEFDNKEISISPLKFIEIDPSLADTLKKMASQHSRRINMTDDSELFLSVENVQEQKNISLVGRRTDLGYLLMEF